MYKKLLVANRGEIAVRIIRTCREMGISTVALYHHSDRTSLHVRLADECVEINSPMDFVNDAEILKIANSAKVDAIHPGYGFLAERADFIRMCVSEGIGFIGPSPNVVENTSRKIKALRMAKLAGFPTVEHSEVCYQDFNDPAVSIEADRLGFPLLMKSCRGGRGRGARLVTRAERLREAFLHAQTESMAFYNQHAIYLEKAIQPAHQIGVQVLGDQEGNIIQLGEREGSLIYGNQKLIEEAPAPCLSALQRKQLLEDSLEIARLFQIDNLATVEFIIDQEGNRYFSEIKPRLQIEHSLTELIYRCDLVKSQILSAAGMPIDTTQQMFQPNGSAIHCRVTAEDPWVGYLPFPGRLRRVSLPGGIDVRVDTYISTGCEIPVEYDPLIATLAVWGDNRQTCISRMQMALEEFRLSGSPSNLAILQMTAYHPIFINGQYDTSYRVRPYTLENGKKEPYYDLNIGEDDHDTHLRDLAIAAAIHYYRRNQLADPAIPERFTTGWHRNVRRLDN